LLPGVDFKCGDLRECSLTGVGVLQLTEQCWDSQLLDEVRLAAAGRACELPGRLAGARAGVGAGACQVSCASVRRPCRCRALGADAQHLLLLRPARTLQAAAKAAAELAVGSVVVDYTGAVVGRLAAAGRCRVLAVEAGAPTSWGAARMHAGVVLRGGGGSGAA
jgi:hypothetical protein